MGFVDPDVVRAVEALLFREARLLDERRLEAWLDLFTEDCRYWLPILSDDTDREPSIIFDDRARMEERVFRLLDTPAHAQIPPSRTVHTLSNIEVKLGSGSDDELDVRCAMVIHEVRIGDITQVGLADPRWFAGRCQYRLRMVGKGLQIVEKRVDLLNRELPQYNLTFVI